MLSKIVCRKCLNVFRRARGLKQFVSIDDEWLTNHTWCPTELAGRDINNSVYIYEPPPDWCPHKLEQAVAGAKIVEE